MQDRETITKTLREASQLLEDLNLLLSMPSGSIPRCRKYASQVELRLNFLLLHFCQAQLMYSELIRLHQRAVSLRRALGQSLGG